MSVGSGNERPKGRVGSDNAKRRLGLMLNEEALFISRQRSVIKEVNDWALEMVCRSVFQTSDFLHLDKNQINIVLLLSIFFFIWLKIIDIYQAH